MSNFNSASHDLYDIASIHCSFLLFLQFYIHVCLYLRNTVSFVYGCIVRFACFTFAFLIYSSFLLPISNTEILRGKQN